MASSRMKKGNGNTTVADQLARPVLPVCLDSCVATGTIVTRVLYRQPTIASFCPEQGSSYDTGSLPQVHYRMNIPVRR
jgi:hypothetical protein